MSEQFDEVSTESVMWLFNRVRVESITSERRNEAAVCKLNDFSEFETYEMMQARDSEDRI